MVTLFPVPSPEPMDTKTLRLKAACNALAISQCFLNKQVCKKASLEADLYDCQDAMEATRIRREARLTSIHIEQYERTCQGLKREVWKLCVTVPCHLLASDGKSNWVIDVQPRTVTCDPVQGLEAATGWANYNWGRRP